MQKTFLRLVNLLICAGFAGAAFGAAISVFNTGESASGTALAIGATDLHFSLISAPVGVPLTAITTSPNPAWTLNTTSADWISPGNNGNLNWPVGDYDYRTTFDLTGLNPATAQLSGLWTSDNNGLIQLNGVNTGNSTAFAVFGTLQAFTITSGFHAGVNTLDFIVTNGGGPTGVFAEISGTATPVSSTPEPSEFLPLLGISVLGLRTVLRRRQVGGASGK